ncbi:hypothetical protein GCM10009664_44760 [Kitasatospora gansuensis]
MQNVRSVRATARRWWPAVLLGALCLAALLGTGLGAGRAALGLLAGGWSLSLIPIHSSHHRAPAPVTRAVGTPGVSDGSPPPPAEPPSGPSTPLPR